MSLPRKSCKWCKSTLHWQYRCRLNPNIKKTIRQRGKQSLKWEQTRRDCFKINPGDLYHCYLCGKVLQKNEVTLDHMKSRSSRPDLRYEMDNLAPACWQCNSLKGSQSLENYNKSRQKY